MCYGEISKSDKNTKIMFSRNLLIFLKRSIEPTINVTHFYQQNRNLRKTAEPIVALTSKQQELPSQTNVSPLRENDLQINWQNEMSDIAVEEKTKSILAPVENPSEIDVEPTILPTFNLAAYVSKSETLQQLIKLGVDFSRIEKKVGHTKFVLNLDFERDMKEHLMFLTKTINMDPDNLGWFLTKNPIIFKESIDDLQTRINYLESKRFTKDDITSIVSRNPYWLMFSTQRIDRRLGFFQREFGLTGNQTRQLTLSLPKLITYSLHPVRTITFSVLEEMGFDKEETKELLLKSPRIWMICKF